MHFQSINVLIFRCPNLWVVLTHLAAPSPSFLRRGGGNASPIDKLRTLSLSKCRVNPEQGQTLSPAVEGLT